MHALYVICAHYSNTTNVIYRTVLNQIQKDDGDQEEEEAATVVVVGKKRVTRFMQECVYLS